MFAFCSRSNVAFNPSVRIGRTPRENWLRRRSLGLGRGQLITCDRIAQKSLLKLPVRIHENRCADANNEGGRLVGSTH